MDDITRNFHLPLPEELYHELRRAAKLAKRPATELARTAIESWLKDQKRQAIAQAIAEYAARQAGKQDLDKDLESATLELLAEEEIQ